MIQKIEELGLVAIIVTLPLGYIPERFRITSALHSVPFLLMLMILFLILLATISRYSKWKNTSLNIGKNDRKLIFLGVIYCVWTIFCIIMGGLNYPFYGETNVMGYVKMQNIVCQLTFFPDTLIIPIGTMIVCVWRSIKESLLPIISLIFIIIHLYHNDWEKGFYCIRKGCLILIGVCVVYSLPEMIWIWKENYTCESFLKIVNVYLYDVPVPPAWYPPLLWYNQLRSLFLEPSSFGVVMSFCYPILHSYRFNSKFAMSFYILGLGYLSLMIFMTQSRTAICLYLGINFLFLFSNLILKNKIFIVLKNMFCIIAPICIGIIFYLVFPMLIGGETHGVNSTQSDYVSSNIVSVANTSERSNGARYGMTFATFRVGMEHPVIGVGRGYEALYIEKNLPEFAIHNDEINGWLKNNHVKGITSMGCFILNQYTEEFAASGILGFVLFITLPIFLLINLIRRKLYTDNRILCLIIALIGQMIAMFAGSYWYTYPITLGLLFCALQKALCKLQ